MNDDISGIVELDNNLRFVWMRAKDGEISGFLETQERQLIKGTSGWYRTNDPNKAASIAQALFIKAEKL